MVKRILLTALIALAVGAEASAQAGRDLLQYLPDGNGVAIVDVQKVVSSEVWTALSSNPKAKRALEGFKSELEKAGLGGTQVSSAAVLFTDPGLKNVVAAVSGTIDSGKVLAGIRSNPKAKLTSEKYKNFDIYTVTTTPNKDVAFVFVTANVVVIGKAADVRRAVDVRSGDKPSVTQNTTLTSALSQTPDAAIRFALGTPSNITAALQSSNMPLPDFSSVKLIFGTIDVTSAIEINATLRNDTSEHASVIADQLNGLLSMARGFLGSASDPKVAPIAEVLKTVTISGADVDVRIGASLSKDLFARIIK